MMPTLPPPPSCFYRKAPQYYGEDEGGGTYVSLAVGLVGAPSCRNDDHERREDRRRKEVPRELTALLQPDRSTHANGDGRHS